MANIGLPMSAEMMLSGTSLELIERDTSSMASIKTAPATKQAGIDLKWSLPNIILATCGTTRPIQPMFPLTLTCWSVPAAAWPGQWWGY